MDRIGGFERMIKYWFVKLFFKLIKDYDIFFITPDDEAYYINDVMFDDELKEIILQKK